MSRRICTCSPSSVSIMPRIGATLVPWPRGTIDTESSCCKICNNCLTGCEIDRGDVLQADERPAVDHEVALALAAARLAQIVEHRRPSIPDHLFGGGCAGGIEQWHVGHRGAAGVGD